MSAIYMLSFVIGMLIGACVTQVVLLFFFNEIMDWVDRVVNKVRKLLNLPPI